MLGCLLRLCFAHGRPTLKNLAEAWNTMLQKEVDQTLAIKTDAAVAFLASLEDPKLTSFEDAGKKPQIKIFPLGMSSLAASISIQKKPVLGIQGSQQQPSRPLVLEAPQQQPGKPLAIEAPSTSASAAENAPPLSDAGEPTSGDKAPIEASGSNSDLAASASRESAVATSTTNVETYEETP